MLYLLIPAFAYAADINTGCTNVEASDAIQKHMILKAVEKTEKQPVVDVDITAPGLAVVSYGVKHIKKVTVTFLLDCSTANTQNEALNNPTGFRVISYSHFK